MPIKVGHTPPQQVLLRGWVDNSRLQPDEVTSGQRSNATPSSGERLTLTKTASNLVGLLKTVESVLIVDTHHVEKIRTALNDGSYEINFNNVAQKLINFEHNL
ncbi:MAG: flagellar biosynthesis anti-sigma factor FlgM [Pseudomonadota bacterium]